MQETLQALGIVGQFFGFIRGFIDLVGFHAFFLMIVTMFVLWAVNMASPLAKPVNYLFVVLLVAGLSAQNGPPFDPVLKYLAVMAAPFFLAQLFQLLWRGFGALLQGRSRSARTARIGELLVELDREVRML